MTTPLENVWCGCTKLYLFDCLFVCFGLFNFSTFNMHFYIMLVDKYVEYELMPSCILFFANKLNFILGGE